MRNVNTEIKMAMYKISRCVDSGAFHKLIIPNSSDEYTVTE